MCLVICFKPFGPTTFSGTGPVSYTHLDVYKRQDFADGKDGICQFRLTEGKKTSYYIAYAPLGMNDWMIGYIVPVKAAEASYDFIREYEITFIIIFSMLVPVVIFYIIYKNRQEKSRLLKRAQRDAPVSYTHLSV